MSGFLSFVFLLLVIWLLLHCIHMFLRLIGEALFPRCSDGSGVRARRTQSGVTRLCPNPQCGKCNRGEARFCARCGQPLIRRSGLEIDHAC